MKIVKVTYTTQPEFAAQNCENIQQVMAELQQLNHPGINYHACLSADNKTFIHTAFFNTEEDQKTLNELSSFKNFQSALKSGGLESPPRQEILSLVGTSKTFF